MSLKLRFLGITFMLCEFLGVGAAAQTVVISSAATCPKCRVSVTEVVAISDAEAGVINFMPLSMARSTSGNFYIVDYLSRVLGQFGSDGQYIRTIGRVGAGPGEYQMLRKVMVSKDGRVQVIDKKLGRQTVYTGDGKLVRTITTALSGGDPYDAVLLANRSVVMNSVIATRASAGFALQEYDSLGRLVKQFEESNFDLRERWAFQRLLAAHGDNELWSAQPYAYRVDLYSSERQIKKTLVRAASWFHATLPPNRPSDGTMDQSPSARLDAVWEDSDGLLWTLVSIPSPLWKPVSPPKEPYVLGKGPMPGWLTRPRYDNFVEVIDPRSGALLTSQKLEYSIGVPFGDGLSALYREEKTGGVIHVLSLKLNR